MSTFTKGINRSLTQRAGRHQSMYIFLPGVFANALGHSNCIVAKLRHIAHHQPAVFSVCQHINGSTEGTRVSVVAVIQNDLIIQASVFLQTAFHRNGRLKTGNNLLKTQTGSTGSCDNRQCIADAVFTG